MGGEDESAEVNDDTWLGGLKERLLRKNGDREGEVSLSFLRENEVGEDE